MASDLLLELQLHGFVTRTAHLIARGHSRRSIARAIERGVLLRVSRGWVATPAANQLSIVAIAQGGKLTGPSAMASRGVWDAVDRRIHVRVPVGSAGPIKTLVTPVGAFARPRFVPGPVVHHWTDEHFLDSSEPPWRVSVIDALVQVGKTAAAEQFVACIESVLFKKALTVAGLPTLFALLPARLQHLSDQVDGTAESGLESLSFHRLRPIVKVIQRQVRIPGIARWGGVGRVDLLIDGWLVIELDGDEFHDANVDRDRNAVLVRLGYRVHRFGYDQVINRWPEVEATILELLRYPPAGTRRG